MGKLILEICINNPLNFWLQITELPKGCDLYPKLHAFGLRLGRDWAPKKEPDLIFNTQCIFRDSQIAEKN